MLTASDLTGLRPATDADLRTIKNDDWKDVVEVDELRVHDGDLALDDDFSGSDLALLVRGDLIVAGTVSLDETATLVVTGRLRCRNLACEGNLEVHGAVAVAETIFGYYEAGMSFFLGAVRAALMVQGNHAFEYDPAQLHVDTHLAFANFRGLRIGTAEQARAVLSEEAYAVLAPLMGLVEGGPASVEATRLLRSDGFLR